MPSINSLHFNKKLSIYLILILSLSGCSKFKKQPKQQNSFMISTLNNTLKGKIDKNLGYYCRLFEFQGKDYTSQLNNAMQGVIEEGQRMGANGLIGLQFTTLPVSQSNNSNNITKTAKNALSASQTESNTNLNNINSIIQACGDMVIIDYK